MRPRAGAGPGGTEVEGVEFVVVAADVERGASDGGVGTDPITHGPRAVERTVGVEGVEFVIVATDIDHAVGIDGGGAGANFVAEEIGPAGDAGGGGEGVKFFVVGGEIDGRAIRAQHRRRRGGEGGSGVNPAEGAGGSERVESTGVEDAEVEVAGGVEGGSGVDLVIGGVGPLDGAVGVEGVEFFIIGALVNRAIGADGGAGVGLERADVGAPLIRAVGGVERVDEAIADFDVDGTVSGERGTVAHAEGASAGAEVPRPTAGAVRAESVEQAIVGAEVDGAVVGDSR